ncbi:DUF2187 family protein [Oceanobacillus timonensis]|uniref:DUF2187 family protein n=1 Tax=Oceanobacillus timonensis TaxID=1926285 RepID=UPI0009BB7E4C
MEEENLDQEQDQEQNQEQEQEQEQGQIIEPIQEQEPVKQEDMAEVGETISIVRGEYKGEKAEVLLIRDNSVIVRIGNHPSTGEPIKTVVNHKNYKRK